MYNCIQIFLMEQNIKFFDEKYNYELLKAYMIKSREDALMNIVIGW